MIVAGCGKCAKSTRSAAASPTTNGVYLTRPILWESSLLFYNTLCSSPDILFPGFDSFGDQEERTLQQLCSSCLPQGVSGCPKYSSFLWTIPPLKSGPALLFRPSTRFVMRFSYSVVILLQRVGCFGALRIPWSTFESCINLSP